MTNSTDTLTLTDFLLARIAEDEARAGSVYDRSGSIYPHLHHEDCASLDRDRPYPCDCGVTARVMAECEAKRRIVDSSGRLAQYMFDEPDEEWTEAVHVAADTLGALACVYRDHPDFREAWA